MQKDKTKKHTRMIFAAAVCIVLLAAAFLVLKIVIPREIITFGSYEQDNDASNGTEPIEWIVLKKKGNQALVISRYALDAQPFETDEENAEFSWETCSLRTWLNDDFYQTAFSSDEQQEILTTNIQDEGTEDQLFVLSEKELKHYFLTKSRRCCQATAYAEAQSVEHGEEYYGSLVDSDSKACVWLLRTLTPLPNNNEVAGTSVGMNGRIDKLTVPYDSAGCVRPVMWISLEN